MTVVTRVRYALTRQGLERHTLPSHIAGVLAAFFAGNVTCAIVSGTDKPMKLKHSGRQTSAHPFAAASRAKDAAWTKFASWSPVEVICATATSGPPPVG